MSTTADTTAITDDEKIIAVRICDSLKKIIASGDHEIIFGYLATILGTKEGSDVPRFSTQILRRAAGLYPGGVFQLVDEITALNKPGGKVIADTLMQRLSSDIVTPEIAEQLKTLRQPVFKEQNFAELAAGFLADSAERIYDLVQEILSTAKGFYAQQADELADDEHYVLAALLATASDAALPGTPLDVALTVLPFGRIAAVSKIVVVKATQKAMASQFAKAGATAVKMAQETAAVQALAKIAEPYASLSMRKIDDLANFAAKNSDKVEDIIEVINKNLEKITPKAVLELEQTIKAKLAGGGGHTDDVLDLLFKSPVRRAEKLGYAVLGDGRVIQTIETSLYTRTGKRTAASAAKTMSDAGLDATFKAAKRDAGHIIPDVLGGADETWNYVIMSDRMNRSVYSQIDSLLEKTPELEGLGVKVYVEFESVEMAQKRIAKGIIWELPGAGDMDPRFIIIGNPLNEPSHKFSEFFSAMDKFFRRLKRITDT